MATTNPLSLVLKEEGVKDIQPIKARGMFAKALLAERNGGTYPDTNGVPQSADYWLNQAIAAL